MSPDEAVSLPRTSGAPAGLSPPPDPWGLDRRPCGGVKREESLLMAPHLLKV